MIDWQLDMTRAPYTGERVLIAVMRLMSRDIVLELKKCGLYKAEVFYAKYSTWDGCWKSFPDGANIKLPCFIEPHAWAEISEPPVREIYTDG